MNGPFAPGVYNDLKIFLKGGLAQMLEENEHVEADDGYIGADPQFAKAKSSPWHPHTMFQIRNTVRARHETVHARMKFFAILRHVFKNDLRKHQEVFLALVVLVQASILKGEGLFKVTNYDDRESQDA